ncbi:MAG: TIGR01620 family protein [Pseudomonadota bacterium]
MTDPNAPFTLDPADLPPPAETPQTAAQPDAPPPAMVRAAGLGRRRGGWLGKVFWGALGALVLVLATNALTVTINDLISRNAVFGQIALVLLGLLLFTVLIALIRELAALSRLASVETARAASVAARSGTMAEARAAAETVVKLYRNRADVRWGKAELAGRMAELVDPDALLDVTERELLAPLDRAAEQEVVSAARQVATVTAVVPMAAADVVVALVTSTRMIRRIAEIYGGRAGTLGAWRLFRAVMAHLVATGAVAVGDDLISSVLGGGVLSKVSRRFGEGVVNGALTARVGLAAMEVCRPMPFVATKRASVTSVVQRALTGLFNGRG